MSTQSPSMARPHKTIILTPSTLRGGLIATLMLGSLGAWSAMLR